MIRLLKNIFGMGAYESANSSTKRSAVPAPAPTDARKELTPGIRKELVRKSRYLQKNSGFSREMVADMAIYSTGEGIKPQAQSKSSSWNDEAEEYFQWWSRMPEVSRRFSFSECQALICRGIDVDGEYFVLRVKDRNGRARIQLVETHRIVSPPGDLDWVDGVKFDRYGAPLAYSILQDDGSFREVPAYAVMHIFEPEQASLARNHPTLQHSINHVLDEMELLALEKIAVKDNADITRVLKTESGTLEDDGDFQVQTPGEEAPDPTDPETIRNITGGKVVALKTGESMDSYQPNRPSPVFTGFLEHLKRDSAAGMLPYEFVIDSSKVGGAGVRLIVAKADRRFSYRQMVLIQRLLVPVWGWVIGNAIDKGELRPVKGWNKVAWVTPRRITVDAGREAQQNRADVETGLKTLQDHFAELGMDFREELEKRAQNARAIMDAAEKYQVPLAMLWKPSGTQMMATNEPEKEEQEKPDQDKEEEESTS